MTTSSLNLDDLSDAELRELLALPEGRHGLRYYFSKSDKVNFLTATTDDEREAILAAARSRQVEHHKYLRERRRDGWPDRQALIEEKMGGQVWRFVRHVRSRDGFKDAVTGRKAKIAYVIESTLSGAQLSVTKATLLDAHERLGLVIGWPPPRSRDAAPEATAAGLPTGAHLSSGLSAFGPRA